MIKRLKLRYFITNMAILSCTLLVGLAVLFVLLYHSEVESSYTVMQEMLEGATVAPPDGINGFQSQILPDDLQLPPDVPRAEETNLPTAMTDAASVAPMIYTYVTTATSFEEAVTNGIAEKDTDAIQFEDWFYLDFVRYGYKTPPDMTPPPYWSFMDPNNPWQDNHNGDGNDSDHPSNNHDGNQDDRRMPNESDVQEPSTSQTVSSIMTTTTIFSSSNADTRPTEPTRTQQPPPSSVESSVKSSSTASASGYTSSSTTTVTTTTTTAVRTETTVAESSRTSSDTAAITVFVPVDEGGFIPDALIAQIGGDGSIESFAGNNSDENDEDRIRKVNHAINEVKGRGADFGTIIIEDTPYRFLYQTDVTGTSHLVLLNRTLEVSMLNRLLVLFFFITILGLAGVFFLSMMLANWTVTPIVTAWEKQKQFVADASHELKTPLAVISANTEVVRANPQESVADSSKWLNYIQSETMRMSKLISNLLSVARMDQNNASRVHAAPISLSEIVSNICMVFDPIVFEHGKTLNSVIQKNVRICAEEDNIKQLLSILLDNAVLHSVRNAQITVSLSQDTQGKIRLAVANTAKDIPKEQLAHLFDRFYRVDMGDSPNSSGLGLSIAKSIVHQMGGTLTVTSENQIVTFLAVLS